MKNSITLFGGRLVSFFSVLMMLSLFGSCVESDETAGSGNVNEKPYRCVSCSTVPEAKAANDNTSSGIYRGVFSGGTMTFDVYNSSETITGKIYFNDHETVDLTARIGSFVEGVFATTLTGILDGNKISLDFRVNEDGTNPRVLSFILPEETKKPLARIYVIKEKSNSMAEVFQGTYFEKNRAVPSNSPVVINRNDGGGYSSETDNKLGSSSLILSRGDKVWVAYANMNSGSKIADSGVIVGNELKSSESGKTVAFLLSDELNGIDSSSTLGLPVYLYSIRVR